MKAMTIHTSVPMGDVINQSSATGFRIEDNSNRWIEIRREHGHITIHIQGRILTLEAIMHDKEQQAIYDQMDELMARRPEARGVVDEAVGYIVHSSDEVTRFEATQAALFLGLGKHAVYVNRPRQQPSLQQISDYLYGLGVIEREVVEREARALSQQPEARGVVDGWTLASEALPEPGTKIDFAVIVSDGFVKRGVKSHPYVDAMMGRSYTADRVLAWRPATEGERNG